MKLFKAVNDTANLHLQVEPENARKGVLIVDDSRFSRNILKDILKNEGYLVVGEAGDGLEAIEMAKEKKPEYIFMDVEMPKLDGLGAIPKILEIDPGIHIIMCTALGQKKIIVEAAKAGAKDYVIKPYKKENIMGVMSVISSTNQKDGQVIPFKAGKKHTEELNLEDLQIEDQKPFAYEEVTEPEMDTAYEIIPDFEQDTQIEDEAEHLDSSIDISEDRMEDKFSDISIDMEEFIEPLDNTYSAKPNASNEKLDSSLESEKLKAEIERYMQDTFVDGEVPNNGGRRVGDETRVVFEITDIEDALASEPAKMGEMPSEAAMPELEPEVFELTDMDDIQPVEGPAYDMLPEEMAVVQPDLEPDFDQGYQQNYNPEYSQDYATDYNQGYNQDYGQQYGQPGDQQDQTNNQLYEEQYAQANNQSYDQQYAQPDNQSYDQQYAQPNNQSYDQQYAQVNNQSYDQQYAQPDYQSYNQPYGQNANPFAYLWTDRFSIKQDETIIRNSTNNRTSFYRCANLENDIYAMLGVNNSERTMMLGMINAYMSLENRLQQKGNNVSFGAKMSAYTGGRRMFSGDILEEERNGKPEICLIDTLRLFDSGLPQTSNEILKKTAFYLAIMEMVNEKGNRIFG